MRRPVSFLVIVVAAFMNGRVIAAAPQPTLRAALHVRLIWGDIEYGDQRIKGQGVILRGEPLLFDVGIVNRYHGPPAAAELDWFERIAATLSRGGRFDSDVATATQFKCTPRAVRSADVQMVDDHLVLGPSGFQYIRCTADPVALGLVPGKYTIAVAWSEAVGVRRFQERGQDLTSIFEFEFRDVLTTEDGDDLLNHLAAHAMLDGRPVDALQLVERVLRRRPSNTTALRIRAEIRGEQGACGEAVEDLQKAARITEGGLDTGNQSIARLGQEQRRMAAENLRNHARGLKCW